MPRPLFPFPGFMPTTPVLPKLYWEAITPEQDALLNEVEAMNEDERKALSYLLAGIRASRTNG